MKKGLYALGFMFVFSLLICPALVEAGAIGELEKRVEALEEMRGFRPGRADWLKFGGELRLDFIVPEVADSYLEVDRLAIDLKATIAEGIYSKGQLRFVSEARRRALPMIPWRVGVATTPAVGAVAPTMALEIDHWYTRFTLGSHWLMAGLTDRFIAPGDIDMGHRRTAGYPLSGIAFWRDEQYNVTLGGMFPDFVIGGDLRYRLSYGSGLVLDRRRLEDHRRFYIPPAGGARIEDRMLHDDDHGQHGDEIGLGLGYRFQFYPEATLDLVGFGILSRAEEPHADVRGLIGWPAEEDQQRIGGRVVFEAEVPWGEKLLMAEYIVAKDGNLDRYAWYVQAGHEFEFGPLIGGRFITGIEPVVRYGQYSVDRAKVFTNPLTWDREQLTLALLTDIDENVSLRTEYDMNDESTGAEKITNNELRVQLRTRW